MPEKKILAYFTPSLSSFAKKDINIFSEHYDVHVFLFNPPKKILTPLYFLRQLWFLLKNYKATSYVSQFAGYHALLPGFFSKIPGKKSFIVTGGTDCVSFPQMGYGNFSKKLLGLMTCLSFRLADKILPVHASLVESVNNFDPDQSGPQGMLAFCSKLKTPWKVVFNGYDASAWQRTSAKEPGTFITVAAGVADLTRFRLKGLDLIFEAAKLYPQCTFTIVGCTHFNFKIELPANVKLIAFAEKEQLIELFSRHMYYLQLSISEGFPNAICEAMLCECIPIGSSVGALSDIIGNTGYVLTGKDILQLRSLMDDCLTLNTDHGKHARERIATLFSIAQRKEVLLHQVAGARTVHIR